MAIIDRILDVIAYSSWMIPITIITVIGFILQAKESIIGKLIKVKEKKGKKKKNKEEEMEPDVTDNINNDDTSVKSPTAS